MTGPWEQYSSVQTDISQSGPWEQYGSSEHSAPEGVTSTPDDSSVKDEQDLKKPEEKGAIANMVDFSVDLGKRVLGSVVQGVSSIPLGVESGTRGAVRQSLEGDAATLMPSSVYMPGIDTDETVWGPETAGEKQRRSLYAERTAANLPSLPVVRSMAEMGQKVQKEINATASDATQKAIADSQISGNLFKGEIDFGKDPSARGYVMQAADVFGSMLPVVATALVTKKPSAAAFVGGSMAAGEGASTAHGFIAQKTDSELMEQSPFFARMVNAGASPEEARKLTEAKAADSAALLQGVVASAGDRFTGKLVTGGLDNLLTKAAGRSVVKKSAVGGAMSSVEEGVQEVGEGLASDMGVASAVPSKEIGEDSAANLVLGAMGGGPVGAGRGVVSGVKDRHPAPAVQESSAPIPTAAEMVAQKWGGRGVDAKVAPSGPLSRAAERIVSEVGGEVAPGSGVEAQLQVDGVSPLEQADAPVSAMDAIAQIEAQQDQSLEPLDVSEDSLPLQAEEIHAPKADALLPNASHQEVAGEESANGVVDVEPKDASGFAADEASSDMTMPAQAQEAEGVLQAAAQEQGRADPEAVAVDSASEPLASDSGVFESYEEADAFRRQQTRRGASVAALPVPAADGGGFTLAMKGTPEYAVGEQLREERKIAKSRADAGILDGDILNKQGKPFTIKLPANNAAKKAGPDFGVVEVKGGYVVRRTAPAIATDGVVSQSESARSLAMRQEKVPAVERQEVTQPASWVIREKSNGAVIMETTDPKKVAALNTEKYEAVPIIEHLAGLSAKPVVAPGARSQKTEPIERAGPAQSTTAATEVMDGDILNKLGKPFTVKLPAINAAKRAGLGYEAVQVPGGYVARRVAQVANVEAGVEPGASQPVAEGEQQEHTDPMVGEQINKTWTAFSPESGTLSVPRSEMPQIKAEHRGAMVNFLKARGIDSHQEEIDPKHLKPTQAEFSPGKVVKARNFTGGDRSILVSSDGYVLDGHHQWLAKRDLKEPVKAIRLTAPIETLLKTVNEFPSAEQSSGAQISQPHDKADVAQADQTPGADVALFSRADASQVGDAAPFRVSEVQSAVDTLTASWANAPETIVVSSLQDPQVPKFVHKNEAEYRSQGVSGDPEGFYLDGKVYLVASQLRSAADVQRVLFHEALGHSGLRGVFGKDLDPILTQLAALRRGSIVSKARQYGLMPDNMRGAGVAEAYAAMSHEQRMHAAEEVLAEMAQDRPEIGYVRRAIAAVRQWLRRNVGRFKGLRLTDDEILSRYILPARGWVERGRAARSNAVDSGQVAFSLNEPDVLAQAQAKWNQLVDDFVRGKVDPTRSHEILPSTPAVMQMLGLPDLPVRIGGHGLDSLYNHGVKPAQLKAMLGELTSPQLVNMWESSNGQSSLNFVTSMKQDASGNPYEIALHVSKNTPEGKSHWVATITERQPTSILSAVKNGRTLYVGDGEIAGVDPKALREALRYAKENRGKESSALKASFASNHRLLPLGRTPLYTKDLEQIKQDRGIRFSRTQTQQLADGGQAGWESPAPTMTDKVLYELQDGRVDLKRVQESIEASGQEIDERFDARLAETLYSGRMAKRTQTFLEREVQPLMRVMARLKVSQAELGDYLHARAAPERNAQIAKVNPAMPDGGAGANSKGLLLTNAAANKYIMDLPQSRRNQLEDLAKRVDAITKGTRALLVTEGLEKAETIAAWESAYKTYVPMFREDVEFSRMTVHKRATGSEKKAVDILANVLMQREAAITKAEKNRVNVALYGLALTNPNPEFWATIRPTMQAKQITEDLHRMGVDPLIAEAGMEGVPTIRTVDPVTNKVVERVNPMYRSLPGAITLKINGEDRVLMLNENDPRAMRMAENLKNLDGLTNFDLAGSIIGKTTRWMAATQTQYNPVFGVVNFVRDTVGGAVHVGNTALRGKGMRVLAHVPAAMGGIVRSLSGGKATEWSKLFEQFQEDGGQTGFREAFRDGAERARAIEKQLARLETAGRLTPMNAARAALGLLDGFNTTTENAVRLAAYKTALDQGISRPEAARLARELTVDFNRKGRAGRELGPLYAFFNASLQGSERTLRALRGPTGKKIIAGGLALGVIQALMLAAAGYDDDEVQDFTKARALIIPLFDEGKRYVAIPLPLGLHVLPNTGRIITELAIGNRKDIGKKMFDGLGEIAGAFNPLGGGNVFTMDGALRTVAPTVVDPFLELGFNKNFAGNQIEKEPFGGERDQRPGASRARESTLKTTTGQAYLGISKALNALTGGSDYEAGLVSPTPERLRYIAQTAGGGVLRELEKIINTSTAAAQGEEVKFSQIPLASRFGGRVDVAQVERARYFDSTKRLEQLDSSLRAAQKAGDGEAVERILSKSPESALIKSSDKVQAAIAKLNKLAMATVNDREAMLQIDEARIEYMKGLNEAVRELEREVSGPTLAQRMRGTRAAPVRDALAVVEP